MAMPLFYLEAAPAVAASPYNQRQLSSGLLSASASSNSLLISREYDKDKDYDRECRCKYEEVYRDIDRDRGDLYNDDNDRDHGRHQRDLERDYRKLHDLRNKYSDCDYRREDSDRDYNRNYPDYPPTILPARPPLTPRYPE